MHLCVAVEIKAGYRGPSAVRGGGKLLDTLVWSIVCVVRDSVQLWFGHVHTHSQRVTSERRGASPPPLPLSILNPLL